MTLFGSLLKIRGAPKIRIFEGVTSFGHFLHFWQFWLKKGQPQCILVLQMTLLDIFEKRKMHVFTDFGELSLILGLLKIRVFHLFFVIFDTSEVDFVTLAYTQICSEITFFVFFEKTVIFMVFRFWTVDFMIFDPSEVDFVTLAYTQICSNLTFFHFFAKSGKTVIFGDFSWKIAVLDQFWHRTTPWVMPFWTLNGIFVTCGPVWALFQWNLAL